MDGQAGKRAVIYARVSHLNQVENSSLELQARSCLDYLTKHGFVLAHEPFIEKGQSAADFDRTAFKELLGFVGQFDVLIVHVQDRLTRGEVLDVWNFLQEFRELGAEIHTTDAGHLDVSDFLTALPVLMRAHVAHEERRNMGRRTASGKRERARAGKVTVGRIAKYGYDYDKENGALTINTAEKSTVENIYQWYLIGDETGKKLGAGAIARKLTTMGVPTKYDTTGRTKSKRAYGVWGRSSVMRILRDETYCGVWYYNRWTAKTKTTREIRPRDEWIAVSVPAIVSRDMWESAQRQRSANLQHAPRNVKGEYLLRGRITCATCGSVMRSHRDKPNSDSPVHYLCKGQSAIYSSDGKQVTCHGGLPQSTLDDIVWEHIKQQIKYPEKMRDAMKRKQAEREAEQAPDRRYLDRCKRELKACKEKLKRYLGLYGDGHYDKAMLDEVSEPVERQKQSLTAKIADLQKRLNNDSSVPVNEAALVRFCEQMSERIDSFNFAQRRNTIEMLQVELTYHRGQVNGEVSGRKRNAAGRFVQAAYTVTGATISCTGLIPLENIQLDLQSYHQDGRTVKALGFHVLISLPNNILRGH